MNRWTPVAPLQLLPGEGTLHVCTARELSAEKAARVFADASRAPVMFAMSAIWCGFATVGTDGSWATADDDPLDWRTIFEVRAFHDDAELRWLHQGGGRGTAVLLSEKPGQLPAGWEQDDCPYRNRIGGVRYLLWGAGQTPTPPRTGWSRLNEHRIPSFGAPVELDDGQRAQVHAIEYLDMDPDSGRAVVVAERLIALEGAR